MLMKLTPVVIFLEQLLHQQSFTKNYKAKHKNTIFKHEKLV